jgi:small subunit ribosomal protein S7
MPRGQRHYEKHEIGVDPKYKSPLVQRTINKCMWSGKKSLARRLVYSALEIAALEKNMGPVEVLDLAIKNVAPVLELKSRRIGGANYQIPVEVGKERRINLAIQWIRDAARSRKGVSFDKALALEIVDAANGIGTAVKKRDNTHRMAEANRAFAHFARF